MRMINKDAVLEYLINWKNSLGISFQDEVIGVVLDVLIRKIESFPEVQTHDEFVGSNLEKMTMKNVDLKKDEGANSK